MKFELRSAENQISEWIAADGEIAPESAAELEQYLNDHLNFAKNRKRYEVKLNSRGGDLIGAVKLGEFLHEHQFITSVGKTIPDGSGHYQPADGVCVSACAVAFIGGVERYASSEVIGIRRFQERTDPALIDYTFRMGVDPRFIKLASATPQNTIRYLKDEELDLLKVNWNPKEFEPWTIKVSGRGVIAFTVSKDKTQTASLFCRADKIARLSIKADGKDAAWYEQAMNHVEYMLAFDITVPKSDITYKKENGSPTIELSIPGLSTGRIAELNRIGVDAEGPRLERGVGFDLPKQNATRYIAVALRNCI